MNNLIRGQQTNLQYSINHPRGQKCYSVFGGQLTTQKNCKVLKPTIYLGDLIVLTINSSSKTIVKKILALRTH